MRLCRALLVCSAAFGCLVMLPSSYLTSPRFSPADTTAMISEPEEDSRASPAAALLTARPATQAPPGANADSRTAQVSSCSDAAPVPSERFAQVLTYVGSVPITALQIVLSKLQSADCVIPSTSLRVVLFAIDGTLLNLLRWGRIVNDNDIDLGFYIVDEKTNAIVPTPRNAHRWQYVMLQRWLFERGLMGREMTARDESKLHHSTKALKPRSCKHRGAQMMQCRLDESNVVVDFFGPETLFSSLTKLSREEHVEPLVQCKAFAFTFPCPNKFETVLRQFTLNLGTVERPETWYEFAGCALLPRRSSERTPQHVQSIIRSGLYLRQCGFPNLLRQEIECGVS